VRQRPQTHLSSYCDIQPGGSGRESGFTGAPYADMILLSEESYGQGSVVM
jgi:hypothetical protein